MAVRRALPLPGSQGLVSAGLALGAGAALSLHQSSQALAAAVMQIDRAGHPPYLPTTPPSPLLQTPAADVRAKELCSQRGEEGVEGSMSIVLFGSLRTYLRAFCVFFHLNMDYKLLW